MKTLYVIRHAKSSWNNPQLGDFDRPLNERGERDAPRMAKRLKEKNVVPDLLLSSPAKRALHTCEHFAEILNYPLENIKTERDLYHAEDERILRIVKNVNNKYDTILLFGHNPGLTDFANRIANSAIANVPTCGIIACSFKIDSWKEVGWEKGVLEFFDFPKKKD